MGIFITNQVMIFTHDLDYCDRVYAVYHMVDSWGMKCDWAITLYEIASILSLAFYIGATIGAFDHYALGYNDPELKKKEEERKEV